MLASVLTPPQLHAVRCVVARVRAEVGPELVQAALFGSRARGEAGPASDIDILLVFRRLPPGREPFASQAEAIAEQEGRRLRQPVSVWSVSLADLVQGSRTPMLVDALQDAIPLWCRGEPLERLPFTPDDAIFCASALLRRTGGGPDASARGPSHDAQSAARVLRDDLVRLCTASLLMRGITRPRRADTLRRYLACEPCGERGRRLLTWAERSFGPDGKDEDRPIAPPPGGFAEAKRGRDALRRRVAGQLGRIVRGPAERSLRPKDRVRSDPSPYHAVISTPVAARRGNWRREARRPTTHDQP